MTGFVVSFVFKFAKFWTVTNIWQSWWVTGLVNSVHWLHTLGFPILPVPPQLLLFSKLLKLGIAHGPLFFTLVISLSLVVLKFHWYCHGFLNFYLQPRLKNKQKPSGFVLNPRSVHPTPSKTSLWGARDGGGAQNWTPFLLPDYSVSSLPLIWWQLHPSSDSVQKPSSHPWFFFTHHLSKTTKKSYCTSLKNISRIQLLLTTSTTTI